MGPLQDAGHREMACGVVPQVMEHEARAARRRARARHRPWMRGLTIEERVR